jgi:putative spermidine/putrescine transport system substrate-binding protein
MKNVIYACVALAAFSNTADARDLVVASNGGIWEAATRKCFVEPYEKKTGKTAAVVLGTPAQWSNQITANPADPQIDVVLNSVDEVPETIKRGIVEPVTVDKVPAIADMDPKTASLASGYGAVMTYSALGIAYNSETVEKPPTSWKEFVDGTIRGDWQVAIPGMRQGATSSAVLWMLANVYGGGVDNIEPGFDAIKLMKESGNLRIWNDMNEFLSLIKTGEIDIGMYWEGRTWAFHDAGNPEIMFVRPAPGVVVNNAIIQKVKNSLDEGWDYLNIVLSKEGQECWVSQMQYGSANLKTTVPENLSSRIAKSEEIIVPPYAEIGKHNREWVERWNMEIDR